MMKYIIIILALLIVSPAFAGTKTLNFAWDQTISPDLAGWKLYTATRAGDPGTLSATITYDGSGKTSYTSAQPITAPDHAETTYYFTLTAFDKSGNETSRSNEVSTVIDFQAPGTPINLKVTVSTP